MMITPIVSPDWGNYPKYCWPHLWVWSDGTQEDINPRGFCELIPTNPVQTAYHWSVANPDAMSGFTKSLDNTYCDAGVISYVRRVNQILIAMIDPATNTPTQDVPNRLRNITRSTTNPDVSYTLTMDVWTDPIDPTDDGFGNMRYSGFNLQYEKSYSFDVIRVEGQLL